MKSHTSMEKKSNRMKGRFEPNYQHSMSGLIMQSYSEIGAFPHPYHVYGEPCRTHVNCLADNVFDNGPIVEDRKWVSSLEFDSKGVYLASVQESGCLTMHNFDQIWKKMRQNSCCIYLLTNNLILPGGILLTKMRLSVLQEEAMTWIFLILGMFLELEIVEKYVCGICVEEDHMLLSVSQRGILFSCVCGEVIT